MQVIEKVKVVPEGYNGAGMDGYNRRDVKGIVFNQSDLETFRQLLIQE